MAVEIVWFGRNCFRLKTRDVTLVTDPVSKDTGFNLGKQTAQIVTVSNKTAGYENTGAVGDSPMVLDAPGEYEVSGVLVNAFETPGREGPNVVFEIEMEEVVICHLGLLQSPPSPALLEQLADVDVLLVPVGGLNALNPAAAVETANLIEPKVVIPMNFKTGAEKLDLAPVDRFFKELGIAAKEPESRLSLTPSGLPSETAITLLDARG